MKLFSLSVVNPLRSWRELPGKNKKCRSRVRFSTSINNSNNVNNQDNLYDNVIVTKITVLRSIERVHPVHAMNAVQRQVVTDWFEL